MVGVAFDDKEKEKIRISKNLNEDIANMEKWLLNIIFLNNTFFYIYSHLEFIHSCVSFFIKTILLCDIFTFERKSPFLTKRLIVDIDSPINFETSFIVKKGLFSELVMVIKWSWNISVSSISYIRCSQALSRNITPTFARGVYFLNLTFKRLI